MTRHEPFIPPTAVPWLAALTALAALCAAWIAQYGFGLAPCELCYWQRYGYWAALAIGVGTNFTPKETPARRAGLWILALAFLATAGIAIFHVGVEQHWWQGFTSCTGAITGETIEDLTEALENAPIVRCDEPAWTMFGISMAGYNVVLALALAAFAAWGASRSKA